MKNILLVLTLIFTILSIFFYNYYTIEIEKLKKDIYLNKSYELRNELKVLIKKKQGDTAALTYILSQDSNIKDALIFNKKDSIDFTDIIKGLTNIGEFKNIWIQILDKDGNSFYRSWTLNVGDNVRSIRKDVAKMYKDPKPMNQVSTGRFDMSFKTMVPIFDKKKFIGMIEMISHFNSIAIVLKHKSIDPIMVVDKSYTRKFIDPLSRLFIGDYYVSNKNASPELMKRIENYGIESFLSIDDYMLFEDYLVTMYEIRNIKNGPMGYILLFYKLDQLDMRTIREYEINFLIRFMIIIVFISLVVILLINKKYLKQLNKKVKEKTFDISKQKEELKSLVTLFDANVIFSRTDLKGYITYVSDAFCDISGYTREELIGQNHNIIRHEDMTKSFFRDLWIELRKQKEITAEVKNRKKDGSYYWVVSNFSSTFDTNGKHIGYSAIRQDITARKEVEFLQQEIEETQREVVFTMGSIGESRSKETGNHVKRVAEYSKIMALHYGLSAEDAEMLKQASPMHDIGKVGIPDSILNKPGILTDNERRTMNLHASLGYDMLKVSKRPLLKMAATIAYEHHEKWDGTGYPNNLSGEDISIYGRITAVADVFDALGSDRCYKKAWDDEKIFKLFTQERGKQFDPKLIDIFFNNIDEFLKVRDTFKDN